MLKAAGNTAQMHPGVWWKNKVWVHEGKLYHCPCDSYVGLKSAGQSILQTAHVRILTNGINVSHMEYDNTMHVVHYHAALTVLNSTANCHYQWANALAVFSNQ